jgi:hypothetical protein
MARAAAAAVLMVLALAHIAEAFDDSMLDSVLVIGSEQGECGRSTHCSMKTSAPAPGRVFLVIMCESLRFIACKSIWLAPSLDHRPKCSCQLTLDFRAQLQ